MRVRPAVVLLLSAAVSVGACARDIGGASVDTSRVGAAVATERGVIESVRLVQAVEGDRLQDNTLGGVTGAAVGGVAGSRFGQGTGKALAVGAGALVGAAAGAATQRELSRQTAVEYVVRLNFGRLVTVVQADPQPLPVGSPVFVQTGQGQRARVIPA